MADYTERFTETAALLYNLAPISVSNGAEAFTSYVSLANYHRAVILIHTGVMASGASDGDRAWRACSASCSESFWRVNLAYAMTRLRELSSSLTFRWHRWAM